MSRSMTCRHGRIERALTPGSFKQGPAGRRQATGTPVSPLGGALLGRRVGDQIEIRINRAVRDYEIVAVW